MRLNLINALSVKWKWRLKMSKKSIVGWVSADFTLSEHFYKNDDGVINLPGLFAIKKAAVAHSEAFWNHSGKVKKVRLTLEEL